MCLKKHYDANEFILEELFGVPKGERVVNEYRENVGEI